MAITNLVDYWQQESVAATAARTAAQADLTAAQAALAAAKSQLATDMAALDGLKATITAKKALLAASSIPMEAEALTLQIRDLIEQYRASQGDVLTDQDKVDWQQTGADAAAEALARAAAALTEAIQAKGAAQTDAVGRTSMKTKLGQAPLSTVKAEATAALAATSAADAVDQLKYKDFPTPLFELAQKRYAARAAHLASLRTSAEEAATKLGDKAAAGDALAGTVVKTKLAFDNAERAVRDYAATARQRLDNAKAVIVALAAIKADPTKDFLTPSELTKVKADADRTAAAAAVDPITVARGKVDTAREALDTALLTSIATDVDASFTDPAIITARGDVSTAEAGVTTAVGTFVATAAVRKALDDWQVLYLDPIWERLLAYFDAKAALDELVAVTTTGAGSLVKALDDAEKAYAIARADAAKARRTIDALTDQAVLREKRRTAAAAMTSKPLSAIRGDSF